MIQTRQDLKHMYIPTAYIHMHIEDQVQEDLYHHQ